MSYPGDFDDGVKKYLEFHQLEPNSFGQLNVTIPQGMTFLGEAAHTAYRSKKWDGTSHDYWHDHEANVNVCVPERANDPALIEIPKWIRDAKTLARLGTCLEVGLIDPDGGKPFRVPGCGSGAGIFCTPDGHALIVASRSKLHAVLWGGMLGVSKRGIVG